MRFLIEYYPVTHDFRIHDAPIIGPDDTYSFELLDRMNNYAMFKALYNFKVKNDHPVKDGNIFPYNNSWWLMIEAKSVQQAINIFWKKMKAYKAKELLKAGAVAG